MIRVKINNKAFTGWTNAEITLRFDALASTFTLDTRFDPSNDDHLIIFKPFTYNKVELFSDDELFLTGRLLTNTFSEKPAKQPTKLVGYSFPGVLEDSEIPTLLYPLQSDQRTLKDICERLIKPFGLKLIVDASVSSIVSKIYPVTTANEQQSIKAYLTELAAQRNVILTHNENGELLMTRVNASDKPVINYKSGSFGKTEMYLTTNGQKMHSDITVQKQADEDSNNTNAAETTVKNPYVTAVFRSKVKTQTSGDDIDTAQAAKNVLASELKQIKLVINTNSWTWPINGVQQLIRPNNIISVQSDELYLFKKTNFFVEQVELKGNEASQTATLTCVVPEVYNNQTPKNIFE